MFSRKKATGSGSTVTVTVTEVSGKQSNDREVEVEASGATVQQVLEKAGMKLGNGMKMLVNGEPADLKTHVEHGGKISLTEKVRGS